MRHHLFNLICVISVAMLAVLMCGYVGRFGLSAQYFAWSAPQPFVRDDMLVIEEGRVAFWHVTSTSTTSSTPAPDRWKIRWIGSPLRLRAPMPSRSLWEFDAHSIQYSATSSLHSFLLAFPIWCVAVPCLIAPAMWYRQRRRRDRAGFPVTAVTLQSSD